MSNNLNRVLELSPEERVVKRYLERAMDGSNPSVVGLRLVQRFATETPDLFCNAALAILGSQSDSVALRFVMVKLLQQPGLMRLLVDPECMGKGSAIRLFKLLKQHDRALDLRLAQCLPSRYGAAELPLNYPSCDRALDVLDAASDGRRIVPILGHLVNHPLPPLSAKATLVVGKRVQSVAWTRRVLATNQHPRNRANAIESLWGVNSAEAVALFWEHTTDRNNRVTGNAVFGLHVLGEPQAEASARKMAHSLEPTFRSTSAWLMAKMRRAEHVVLLKQLVRDDSPGVRRAALKALVDIHQERLRREAEEEKTRLLAAEVELEQQSGELAALAQAVEQEEPAPDVAEREFKLRLDGRSFSFR